MVVSYLVSDVVTYSTVGSGGFSSSGGGGGLSRNSRSSWAEGARVSTPVLFNCDWATTTAAPP
eukprot:CAMPEP_0168786278 /NCGR_PEP_ID=MMETSP0725-20121227/11188_1 /TAXON_ID=265536 /ORGANISM="Amphiprora sp., Strain CCMP467" /LENGTH=62 /DNA_ID=CAMNT_0008836419 /DNA_START=100 /DNA_END=285 /DNA_ORIENTATION=-